MPNFLSYKALVQAGNGKLQHVMLVMRHKLFYSGIRNGQLRTDVSYCVHYESIACRHYKYSIRAFSSRRFT